TCISFATSAIVSPCSTRARCSTRATSRRSSARSRCNRCSRPVSEEAPFLKVDGLSAAYGRSQALFGVSLTIPARGAVAVLGRNGAGKSTLLKTLFGELLPTSGTIRFDGAALEGEPAELRVRRGMGYVPQEHAIF